MKGPMKSTNDVPWPTQNSPQTQVHSHGTENGTGPPHTLGPVLHSLP